MLFYQVGEFFQDLAVKRSRKSISDLLDIRPDSATVRRNGELTVVSSEDVAVGEVIVVKPGEKIPLDGIVLEGRSMLDTKALTGESVPRSVCQGEEALNHVRTVVFDKTGTLTKGVFKVMDVLPANGFAPEAVLAHAALPACGKRCSSLLVSPSWPY